jgi:hypothetical protein
MKKYYPYKSDKPEKKYYIITKDDKKVYFGAAGYDDFTTHKDEERRQRYIARHKKNEDWTKSGIDTPGFWAYHYLWSLPSKTQAYQKIKQTYL